MGVDQQRRHPRYPVHFSVRYETAEAFVADYVENLSLGGVFIVGATHLDLDQRVEVSFELPDHGTWLVVAKVVFILAPEAAAKIHRKAGAGLEMVEKPPGFSDALLGYLLRLGRRRDHAVIAAEIPGIEAIAAAGYNVVPLCMPAELAPLLAKHGAAIIAVIVPPSLVATYSPIVGVGLFTAVTPDDIQEILGRIDSLL